MNIIFMRTTDDNRCLNKKTTTVKETTGKLKDNVSIVDPVIIVKHFRGFNKTNLVYIPYVGRYYFVKNITLMPSDFLEIELHEDVLMTYASDIKSVRGLVKRQEKLYSDYIVDHKMLTQVQRKVSKVNVGKVGTTNGSIILTVTN